jgi:hypothetical protein
MINQALYRLNKKSSLAAFFFNTAPPSRRHPAAFATKQIPASAEKRQPGIA